MYQIWNKEVFNYFFNSENNGQELLFNVDIETIQLLGRKLKIENPLSDFCRCVAQKILKRSKNNNFKINVDEIKTDVVENIPRQTAVIAFFILAASIMQTDKEHSCRNYYERLKKLLLINLPQNDANINSKMNSREKDKVEKLFYDFQNYLNLKLNGKKGYIYFRSLYEKEGRSNRDFVGIPKYQSMMSQNDRCLLTKIFDKKSGEEIYITDLQDSKFSTVFKMTLSDTNLQKRLLDYINNLNKNWDGLIQEIYDGIKRSKINIKLLYVENGDEIAFFEYFLLRCNDIENIKVSGKIFRREDSLFINEIGISSLAHFNNQEAFCETEKISFKFPEKELVLFKLDAEKGYYMQVNSLNVGDTFSILAYPSVLKQNLDEILCITGLTEEQFTKKLQKPEEITQDKLLVHNLTAKKPSDSFLTVKEKTVIKLARGLKVNNEKNTYLCNAQPQIYLKSNVREVYLNNNPVSADELNNRIKNPGIYQIRANNNNKKFVITANPTENEHKNLIFHTFSEKNSIEITNEASGQFCISGVHIYNDKEANSEINAKISKLLFIINALKKKQTRQIPFSFVKKERSILHDLKDKKIKKYLHIIEQDKRYSSAQLLYLSKIKKLIGENID